MADRRAYDATLPLYAAWSLESPIFTAMICVQVEGNETRIIGSKSWKLQPLHFCFADALNTFPWRRYHTHIIPYEGDDRVWQSQFESYGWYSEHVPNLADTITLARALFATMKIDSVRRPWTGETENNIELIEALNAYAPRPDLSTGGYIVAAGHTEQRFFARAIEIFAAWVHAGNGKPAARGPAPDYKLWDKAVI